VVGYFTPIATWGHIKPVTARISETNPSSVVGIETANALLLNFPIVKKDDMIIETQTNKRWRVDSEQSTELIRSTVHQDIVMQGIPRDSIEYSIDIGI
jgi:hypothetical protein